VVTEERQLGPAAPHQPASLADAEDFIGSSKLKGLVAPSHRLTDHRFLAVQPYLAALGVEVRLECHAGAVPGNLVRCFG
jgi:hypothetical protein